MIKHILRIAKMLSEIKSRRGDPDIDEIQIVIKVPISKEAGFRSDKPRGSVTIYDIRYEKTPIYNPRTEHFHFIGDVFDTFDLKKYIREYEEVCKKELAHTRELMKFREGSQVRFKRGDLAGVTGKIWSGQAPHVRVQLDSGAMADAHTDWLELID